MNICVYGASSDAIDRDYIEQGECLGKELVRRGHGLVFGGGAQGMMGAVCRGAFAERGYILGIAPGFFRVDGVLSEDCTEFITTETMRDRKELMERRADAFVMTPGGIGTFEEFFEILTLKQLGRHNKPIAILNTRGYFDPLLEAVEQAIGQGFMKTACRSLYQVSESPTALLDYLEQYQAEKLDVRHLKNI